MRGMSYRAFFLGAGGAFASAWALQTVACLGETSRAGGPPEPVWAYPSPYDADASRSSRFLQRRDFTTWSSQWNLRALLAAWEESDTEETWPWVWTWRNPNGPHFVFVGVDDTTLELARSIAGRSEKNNLTVVVPSVDELDAKVLGDLYAARCAVIEQRPQQIDFEAKVSAPRLG